MPNKNEIQRCAWVGENPVMIKYHDTEWGVPAHDDRTLFESLTLSGAQAGLSWQMVLNKRANYRKAFNNFAVKKIAKYGAQDIKRLLADAGIIRNRLKITATINNAKRFLEVQKEFGSFDTYVWQFVGNKTIQHKIRLDKDTPVKTRESDAMSDDLRRRDFKFVGSTICYAFMQSVGMVNDHQINCFRRKLGS